MPLPHHTNLGPTDSLEHYLRLVLEKRSGTSERPWMFRGHRDGNWPPLPQIDRPWFVAYYIGRVASGRVGITKSAFSEILSGEHDPT